MEPPATRGHLRPAVKVKMEVKEEPEYIYVDETVCRVKLEERDEEVILPKDDTELDAEAALLVLDDQLLPPLAQSQPARRGRKPRVLRASRGSTNTCTTTARKILPRPSPIPVPLTLSHLQPPPQALPLPPAARSKTPQQPVMVKQTLPPPPPTNSGRKILPWPRQLSPASLTAAPLQQLQPLTPNLTSCPPSSSAQPLPLTHLQPITPGGNNALVPLQPLSLTQLRSPPPSSCISQLGVPLSPQKVSLPLKGSRKAPAATAAAAALPHLAAGTPTPCTRVPLLPLSEATIKKSSSTPALPTTTTVSHVRKLLPRPLKQLHPAPPVCTHQTVSLQQLQSLSPATTQTTSLTLQALPVGGQPPPLSGSSQMVSLQHVRTMAVPPPQQVRPPEAPLQPPQHLHTLATSTSPQRVTFQPIQQGPPLNVSQAVAIQSLPATTLCQVHSLQSAVGHPQASLGSSLQTPPALAPDTPQTVPIHLPSHTPGDLQAPPQVSPGGSQNVLPQPAATSQAEPHNKQDTLTLPITHSLREGGAPFHLCPDTGQATQGQDVISLRLAPRQSLATVASGLTGGATPNGAVLKVPIQPLRSSVALLKPKRKYLRRNPWGSKKKDVSVVKMGSVTTYSRPLSVQEKDLFSPSTTSAVVHGRKILPRLSPASLGGSQLKHKLPVTTQSPSGWLVSQVGQHESCGAVGASVSNSATGTLTCTLFEPEVPSCSLSHRTLPTGQPDTSSLASVEQEDTDKSNAGESFLQPISPARAVAACTSVPLNGDITAIPESNNTASITQGVEAPTGSLEMDNCKMEASDLDQHRPYHGKDSLGSEGNGVNPSNQLPDGAGAVLGELLVTVEENVETLGDSPEDSAGNKATLIAISEDSSLQQPTSLGTPEDTSQDNTEDIQKIPEDNTSDHPASQNTLEESQTTPRNSTVMEPTSESSMPSAAVSPALTTTGTAEGEQKGLREEEVEDGQASPDSLLKNNTVLTATTNQPLSPVHECDTHSPSSSVLLFQYPSSTSPSRFKSDETGPLTPLGATTTHINTQASQEQITASLLTQDLPAPHLCQSSRVQPPSLMPQESLVNISESPSTDRIPNPASPHPLPPVSSTIPQAMPALHESSLDAPTPHSSQKENKMDFLLTTACSSITSDSVASHSISPSLPDVVLTEEEEHDIPMTLLPLDSSDYPSHSSYPNTANSLPPTAGQLGGTANTTAVVTLTATTPVTTTTTAAISSTTTVTTTTTSAAICTTTSVTATHTSLEKESPESSSQSEGKVDLSPGTVPIGCCLSEPTPPVEQDAAHPKEECQAPPPGQRKVWRHQQHQHRDTSGARLKALVRAQRRTIQTLRQKLYREQRRSRVLSEMLRRIRTTKTTSEGEECADEDMARKGEEERTGVTQPKPSPPVTRSRNRVKQGTAPTYSAAREKRKQEEQSTEALKKVASLDDTTDQGLEEDGRSLPAISILSPAAGNTELQTLVQEFMTRDDVSRPDGHGSRHPLYYLPLLHKRFMADCCQPCTLETFRQNLPTQVMQRVGEELDACVCLTCQNPELKVESLVRRRLLPLNTRLEEVAFTPETTFREFLAGLQPLKARSPSQLSYSEWFLDVGGSSSIPQPQKRTLTRPIREVVALLEGELELLRPHLARAAQQYEATFRAKCEAEQSPCHAVLQAEWAPLIILHSMGAEGTPAMQHAVNLQCGYLWSHADSLGYIAVSGCQDQRAAAVCASLEPLLARLVQQGVRCLTLLVDPKTDLSTVLEYARRSSNGTLEVRWVFSEPGHGAGVAEAVGNSVTQLICDTVNAWGLEAVRSAKDVFNLISPNSSNLVYYYSEEDVWRSGQLMCSTAASSKTANKLIKPKTLLSM